MNRSVVAVFLVMGLLGCQGGVSSRVHDLVGGDASVAILQQATKVTATRIDWDLTTQEHKPISKPVALSKEQASNIAALVLDDGSYLWDLAKGCEPTPGVILEVSASVGTLQVLLCFECSMLRVNTGSWEDFDSVRHLLVNTVQSAFPDDETIQNL